MNIPDADDFFFFNFILFDAGVERGKEFLFTQNWLYLLCWRIPIIVGDHVIEARTLTFNRLGELLMAAKWEKSG